jgi:4-diphosphocytidyl-2-C-methyl-D-erythritol kinase
VLTVQCPAKLNLFLAITGRRSDGFHDLVSVVAPLEWGDTLRVNVEEQGVRGRGQDFSLECDDRAVPVDASNLVLKAAEAFRAATGWTGGARFALEKRVPVGAGLGGGSSDAAAALRALNRLAGEPLDARGLIAVAANVGSDCALFLHGGPVVMRGRGERVAALADAAAARLRGRSAVVFKPAFGIPTAWAYRQMAAEAPAGYLPAADAEARLAAWVAGDAAAEELLFNNMEAVAFRKFPALPALLDRLRQDFGLRPRMSGSGSACFALLEPGADEPAIAAAIRRSWGDSALVVRTRIQ